MTNYPSLAQTIVWERGFETSEGITQASCATTSVNTLANTNCIPTSWQTGRVPTSGSNIGCRWVASTSFSRGGTGVSLRFLKSQTGWLMSHGATLTAGVEYSLDFYYRIPATGSGSGVYTIDVGHTMSSGQQAAPTLTTVVSTGANSTTYSAATTYKFTPVTTGTYYIVLRTTSGSTARDAIHIDDMTLSYTAPACTNPTNGGTIAGPQNDCSGYNPGNMTSTVLPSGHTGTLEYKWQSSTTSAIAGFNTDITHDNTTYDPPNTISQTTWFRRLARVTCAADWSGAVASNAIEKAVIPKPTSPSFSAGATSLCADETSTYTASATGGTGVSYSILSGGATINSSTGEVSSVTSDFIVQATISNCSGSITVDRGVTITPAPTSPSFTAGATSLCAGGTSTYTASATGGTSVSYSILSGGGASVNSGTGVVSNVVSDFTVRATISNCSGSITVDRAVTINTNPTAGGILSANEINCSGFNPAEITSTAPSGHTGVLEYKWQSSTTGATAGFSDITPAAVNETYDPAPITQTTWYKRLARVIGCTAWTESNVVEKGVHFTQTDVYTTSQSWTVPAGITQLTIECWGGGGSGGGGRTSNIEGSRVAGNGGKGGMYSRTVVSVNPNDAVSVVVGTGGVAVTSGNGGLGGHGGRSYVTIGSEVASASGGRCGAWVNANQGDPQPQIPSVSNNQADNYADFQQPQTGTGTFFHSGHGGFASHTTHSYGGAGGGAGGSTEAGSHGQATTHAQNPGVAFAGGTGGAAGGGKGGDGGFCGTNANCTSTGQDGTIPGGGGGGGAARNANNTSSPRSAYGGHGARGEVRITYGTIANPTNGGTIAGAESNCGSFNPAEITSSTLPTGHTGTLEYQWQSSTTSATAGFSDIPAATSATYDPPNTVSVTTWYRRLARVLCTSGWAGAVVSNVIEKTVGGIDITTVQAQISGLGITLNDDDYLWTGNLDAAWDGAGNWLKYHQGQNVFNTATSAPASVQNVFILNATIDCYGNNIPVVPDDATPRTAKTVYIGSGATLDIRGTLKVYGDWLNEGTFVVPSGTRVVEFSGSSNQYITSGWTSGTDNSFHNLNVKNTGTGTVVQFLDNTNVLNKTTVEQGRLLTPAGVIVKTKQSEVQSNGELDINSNAQYRVNE